MVGCRIANVPGEQPDIHGVRAKATPLHVSSSNVSDNPRLREKALIALFGAGDPRVGQLGDCCDARQSGVTALVTFGDGEIGLPLRAPAAWQPEGVIAVDGDYFASTDDHYRLGLVYPLDLSSVFAVMAYPGGPPGRTLDLCAAPGGKSFTFFRVFQPIELVSNEVIAKRCGILRQNVERLQLQIEVISKSVEWLAEMEEESFHTVLLDVPCSGQSLLCKGEKNPGAWHPITVNGSLKRQRRILSKASTCVDEGGTIVYSTCTYGREENEEIIAWFLNRNPNFQAVPSSVLAEYQSEWADFPCYRLWPWQGYGAGAFACALRRMD